LAAGAARAAAGELARLTAEEERAAAALAKAEAWLLAHGELSPLASQWERWKRELDRLTAAWYRLRELEGSRPACEARRAAGRAAEQQAREARDRSEASLAAARGALAAAEAEASAWPAGDLRAQRSRWDSRREGLREVATAAQEASETLAEERDARSAAEKASAARRAAEDQGRDALVRAVQVRVALGEADHALAQVRLALDLSSHRAELREGESCPLCGATSHPWTAEGSPVAELVFSQQGRVEALRAELTGLERLEAASRQKATAAAAALEAESARSTALSSRLAALQELWETGRRELPDLALPADVTDPSAGDRASAGLREAGERLRELQAAEERAEELARAVTREQKTLDTAREALERDEKACFRAAQETAAAEQALQELERRREVEAEACRGHLTEVAPAFDGWDGWRPSLEADPAAFARACGERVIAWNAHAAERDGSLERLAALRPGVEGARTLSAERSAQAEGKAEEEAEKARTLEALRAERSSLLGGRPTGQAEAELNAATRGAAEGREQARAVLERAQQALAATSASREAGEAALAGREAERETAARALVRALADAGLDVETLRARLTRDEAWVADLRSRLDTVAKAAEATRAVHRERLAQRQRHEETGRPDLSAEQAAEAAGAAEASAAGTEEERYRCRLALDQDDAERGRVEELIPRIEAQRRTADLWRGLCDLIGSADGKRFRVFAQSLTLDALLGHANEHLCDLAPRYRLERVPGHDLELQVVDQDMGDEVRAVASLSGGESFLVSMALALGLSSLSSRTAAVGSLFVDEGFGSLDPDTLEVALAALDSLQASGRKVGLISHVPGLAERIGARVQVVPLGGGRSRVEVLG
jgi:exonuclease SbcC